MNENGEIIQKIDGRGGPGSIFYSKKGLSRNTGIYEWSFKCEGMHLNDMIGVTSSLENISEVQYAFYLTDIVHFWWAHSGVWLNASRYQTDWNKPQNESFAVWDKGDIVSLVLNTNTNILVMMKNRKTVFVPFHLSWDDEKDKDGNDEIVWYPFIQSGIGSKYSHIV